MAFTGTDAGQNNTNLRITAMGRKTISGTAHSIWRLRNASNNDATVNVTTTSSGVDLTGFVLPAHTDTFIRSTTTASPTSHTLSRVTPSPAVTVSTQSATTTTWTNSTLIDDPLCAETDTAMWIAHSAGLARIATTTPSTLLLDIRISGGVEAVAVELGVPNVWAYTNGGLRGYDINGNQLMGRVTVSHAAGITPKLAIDDTADTRWLGLGQELYLLDFYAGVLAQVSLTGTITDIQIDYVNGNTWVATTAGISIVRPGTAPNTIDVVTTTSTPATTLAPDPLSNGFWVGTATSVDRYDTTGQPVIVGANTRGSVTGLAADGSGGAWATVSNLIVHFSSTGAEEWTQSAPGDSGIAARLAGNPLLHKAWTLGGTQLRSFTASAPPSNTPIEVPKPGVTAARTYFTNTLFVDLMPPIIEFAYPELNGAVPTPRPAMGVNYADQANQVDTASLQFKLGNDPLLVTCSTLTTSGAVCTPQSDFPEGVSLDVSASVADTKGNRSAPTHVYFVVDTVPPVITSTTPVNGGYANKAQGPIEGTLSKPGFVTIGGSSPVATDAFNHFSVPVTLSEGLNSMTILAEDRARNETQLAYSVTLDTQMPAAPVMANVAAVTLTAETTTVSGSAGAVEANATVRVINIGSGAVVTAIADATGSFTAQIAAQAGQMLRVIAEDRAGNASVWEDTHVQGSSTLTVNVSAPANGSTVTSASVMVSGTVVGVTDAAVTINGFPVTAISSGSDTSFSDLVALTPGTNLIQVRAAQGTATGTEQFAVTYATANPFSVIADMTSGVVPVNVAFLTSQHDAGSAFNATFDFENDGLVDQTIDTPGAPVSHAYRRPGSYTAHVVVTGADNVPYAFDLPITVSSENQIDAFLRTAWTGFLNAMSAGDATTALTFISVGSVDHFGPILQSLQQQLSTIANDLSEAQLVRADTHFATYGVTRTVGTEQHVFLVQFIRDPDGVWRIAEM